MKRGCILIPAIAAVALVVEKHGPLLAIYVFMAGSALLWAHECERANGRPLWPLLPRRRG